MAAAQLQSTTMHHDNRDRISAPSTSPSGWFLSRRRGFAIAARRLYAFIGAKAIHAPTKRTEPQHAVTKPLSNVDGTSFWVTALGPVLDTMLAEGQYSPSRRQEMAEFFAKNIATCLGPEPTKDALTGRLIPSWKSFMTDDFTPLEPSWTWKGGRAHPMVKFSVEAIPLSVSAAGAIQSAMKLADSLDTIRDSHVHFDREALVHVSNFLTTTSDPRTAGGDHDVGSTALSQIMIGFDVHYTETHVKAYIIPTLRAAETGLSKLDTVTSAVRACGAGASWEPILAYLTKEADADPFLLAIDCASLESARFKVYVRFPTFDVDRLIHHASLGGRIVLSTKFVDAIRDLWGRLTLDTSSEGSAFSVSSQTSGGVPMYFSVQRGCDTPTPKFYIPVRLLGWADDRIAETIGDWMCQYGNPEAGKAYRDSLQKLSPNIRLAERRGFHTYVGVVPLSNGDLEPSVYLNPGVFS